MRFELLNAAHIDEVFRLWSDFDTVKFTNWNHTPDLAACSDRMAKVISFYSSDPHHFGPYVIWLGDGSFGGMIGADLVDRSMGEYDIWYIILRDYWHRGIAMEAVGQLLRQMRATNRAKRVTASVVVENTRSGKLLERSGFVRDSISPGAFQKHGATLDLYRYSLPLHATE